MNFSKPVTYAIRALIYLARNAGEGAILSSRIAEAEDLPAPYLIKVLGALTTQRLVTATRGRGGGFLLAKPASEINLFEIFVLFEGLSLTKDCLLGLGKCGEVENCPVHSRWMEPKGHMETFLMTTTVADLAFMRESVS